MRITPHAVAAVAIAALAAAVAVPVLLDVAAVRTVTVEKLSVDPAEVRKPLATADHAIGAIVPSRQGLVPANPFIPPEKGRRGTTLVPEPPPPPFDLPEPPPTPFVPGG